MKCKYYKSVNDIKFRTGCSCQGDLPESSLGWRNVRTGVENDFNRNSMKIASQLLGELRVIDIQDALKILDVRLSPELKIHERISDFPGDKCWFCGKTHKITRGMI